MDLLNVVASYLQDFTYKEDTCNHSLFSAVDDVT